jgi:hypothetical protein
MPNRIDLKGFKEFKTKLKTLPSQVRREIGFEVLDAAQHWEQRAKRDVPKDQGRLAGTIHSAKVKEMESEVTANAEHAPYMEWGTKKKVKVPADIADYAAQFRGGGSGGGNAKEHIYAWMRRVGIPAERQWFVFISIIVNGVTPHPFFFIQMPVVAKQLYLNIGNILTTGH